MSLIIRRLSFNSNRNLLFYVLSDCEKSLPTKSLNFIISSKKLDYADYLVHFKLIFRDIRNLHILSNEDLGSVKAKPKEAVISSYRSYHNNVLKNLSKEELIDFQNFSKNKDLTIQKSDKGNSCVMFV